MNAPAIPLLICSIGGTTVRWYDRKDADGLDDWPWLAAADILKLSRLSHAAQVETGRLLAEEDGAITIVTADGALMVISDWSANGLIAGAIDAGLIHSSVADLVRQGTRIALALILADMPPEMWAAWFDEIEARPKLVAGVAR